MLGLLASSCYIRTGRLAAGLLGDGQRVLQQLRPVSHVGGNYMWAGPLLPERELQRSQPR
jgi:hypothetical protein